MQIKALFFDLDGLIFDTEKIYVKYWIEASKFYGFELKYQDALLLRSCDSHIAENVIKTCLGEGADYSLIRKKRKELMKEYFTNHKYELKKDIIEFLAYLSQYREIKKIIVTSSHLEEKKFILSECGILSCFDDVISCDSVKKGKPFPDIYLMALDLAGVCSNEVIAFEDSPNGIKSAYYAGITVVMIPDLSSFNELNFTFKNRIHHFDNLLQSIPFIESCIK